MSNGTNILILSAGTRDKVVQYFKRSLAGRGRVLATDMSEYAPAIYDADEHFIVPSMNDEGYLDVILGICRDNDVKGVLSLIDPELSLLAKNAGRFEAVGTTVIGSSYDLCELALDKFEMFKWLSSHGYRCARSWMDRGEFHRALECGEVGFPVFVKPARGSASLAISKVSDADYLDLMIAQGEGLMIQEFLDGQEIGADVYVDIVSGEVVSIFTKKKLKMRAGETDKAVSFKDQGLFDLIERFVKETGFRGQVDIDIFDIGGEYYISEVNPRFGGGYPHAYEAGCDHVEMIVNNLNGIANEPRIGAYDEGIVMMKYNELHCMRIETSATSCGKGTL